MEVKKSFAGNFLSGFSQKAVGNWRTGLKKTKSSFNRGRTSCRKGWHAWGVRVAPLNTEELIELFYELFNPGEKEKGGVKIAKN